jgi:co-chaperonin GroES (HSP10)
MQVGRIIAQSPLAYSYEKWPDETLKPQAGQLVWFARYAGAPFEGLDGREYRIVKDKDIGAVIAEPGADVIQFTAKDAEHAA